MSGTGHADDRTPREIYDQGASGWVRTGPLSLSDYTARPFVIELCLPVAGARVLDLGCGEGYCSRQIRARGAAEVIGVDLSEKMIAAAAEQERVEPLGIRYEQGDATDLARFARAQFDLVMAVFLFNYLPLDGTAACMREVARILRPGGKFVFSVPHPAFPYMRKAAPPFYFDVGKSGYFEARNTRFPGRIWKRDGTALDVQVVHKTIEDYFAALGGAGFERMPTVRELRVTPEILAVDPAFFGPLTEVPLHVAFAVVR